MVSSMTGFGRAELTRDNWNVKLEIKSVNHRYLDMALRLPKAYGGLEDALRRTIQGEFARGRVEVFLNIEEFGEQTRMVKVDKPLLKGYVSALQEVQKELGFSELLSLEHILKLPDVMQISEPEINWEELEGLVLETLHVAITQLQNMRSAEGEKLAHDILHKLTTIEHLIQRIEGRAPEVVIAYRRRLEERISEILQGTSLSEDRLVTEVAIFADRCSIDEELVRLGSHIQQFRQSFQQTVPVGRKLDFLLQEMNREINTIGSKANDGDTAGLVVEVKSELEKIREQVQNIE